jgi:hypothetical protein
MASVLKVNTLTGVTTAGSIAVTGEGNSTTTNLQQGLCKAWIDFNGTGTIAIRDSLNMTSITDNGTSDYTHTIANDFNSANYSFQMEGVYGGGRSYGDGVMGTNFSKAAGSMRTEFMAGGSDQSDLAYVNATHHGDLA